MNYDFNRTHFELGSRNAPVKEVQLTLFKTAAAAASITSAMLLSWTTDHAQSPQQTKAIQSEVSAAEIERTLRAIDVDRTSGSDGERASAEYLDRQLAEYGIAHTTYQSRLYLSWPGRAGLAARPIGTIRGKTAAFAAATPSDGLRGRLVFEPTLTRRVDQTLAFDSDVRDQIPVVRGIADTEALVLAGQQAGALAVLQIDATDTLHEDIVTTIWGTPTSASASRLPKIPYICIRKSDGERLTSAASKGPMTPGCWGLTLQGAGDSRSRVLGAGAAGCWGLTLQGAALTLQGRQVPEHVGALGPRARWNGSRQARWSGRPRARWNGDPEHVEAPVPEHVGCWGPTPQGAGDWRCRVLATDRENLTYLFHMMTIVREVRYALRLAGRNKGFAFAVLVSTALGTAVLLSVTILATYVPARRASQVDPQAALRAD